jgi:Pregnancy-associated plasma protein-A.
MILSVISKNNLLGQAGCGTYISGSQKSLETKFTITEGKSTESLPQINRTLCINVYVVKEQTPPYFDTTKLTTALNGLNQFFSPIALSFTQCVIKRIDNFQFDNLDANGNQNNLITLYSEPNVINLYLVSSITDNNGNSSYGYTFMPGDTGKNFIFMAKGYLSGINLAHQIGHFFNLYHINETSFGNELPDGSNCTTTGDRCCDTPASPDLSLPYMVSSNCTYIGSSRVNNQIYSPSVKNLMGLGTESCKCVFSRTQFLRMIYALNNYRSYLR